MPMETIHKVEVVDRRKIKSIEFKHPELMGEDASSLVKKEYEELVSTQDALYAAREQVRQLEKKVAALEKSWNAKKDMFDIEFESTEKEVKTQKSFLGIGGDLVYTYKF